MPVSTRNQHKSAIKIQANARGRLTRKKGKNTSRKSSPKSSSNSSSKSSPKECPICLEEVNKKNASKIQCSNKHLYHDKCIQKWMHEKTECPLCKENLIPDNLIKIKELIDSLDMVKAENFGIVVDKLKEKFISNAILKKNKLTQKQLKIIELLAEYTNIFESLEDLIENESNVDFLAKKKDGVKILKRMILHLEAIQEKLITLIKNSSQSLLNEKAFSDPIEKITKPNIIRKIRSNSY